MCLFSRTFYRSSCEEECLENLANIGIWDNIEPDFLALISNVVFHCDDMDSVCVRAYTYG